MKPEKEETPKDEMEETPAQQKKEAKEGTEEHGDVKIPEQFQVQCTALVNSCNDRHCLDFLRSLVNKKDDELRESEIAAKNKNKPKGPKTPNEFSADAMPSVD